MNTIQLIGRLTRDPERRSTTTETDVCTLRLAIPRRRRSDGEDPGAVFVDVVTFAGLARSCEHLTKGRQVAVTGRLELSEWEDGNGQHRSRHEVIAEEVMFLERPKAEAGSI